MLYEVECLVSNEHLFHLFGESGHDRVAIADHRESFFYGELCRLALREEEVGLCSPGLQRSGEGESSGGPVSAGSGVGAGDLPWLERSGR